MIFRLMLLLCLVSWPAQAQLQRYPATPDIVIGADASATYVFPGSRNGVLNGLNQRIDWIWIQNDCANDLAFALDPPNQTDIFPIRLPQDAWFWAPVTIHSIGASNVGAGTACTFSIQPLKK